MKTTIIFPSNSEFKIDSSFDEEFNCAKKAGFDVALISPELFWSDDFTIKNANTESVLYRGWILNEKQYSNLEKYCINNKLKLFTSYMTYINSYYFPNWYSKISDFTPESIIITDYSNLDNVYEQCKMHFTGAIMVKDFLKSRKHEWHDACFIPDVLDKDNFLRVVKTFLSLQEGFLVGGLVFRKFLSFNKIGLHVKSKMPLINEHRIFIINGKPFCYAKYWEDGKYESNCVMPSFNDIEPIIKRIDSNFYAIDIAELQDKPGKFVVVEINDGGTAGIPETFSKQEFYNNLYSSLK